MPHASPSSPPPAKEAQTTLTSSTALLTHLVRGAGDSPAAYPATPCPLFPTESEDYYCLSCYTPCSGLALLVGPHTNHDYLPLNDALLYMPAALLREAHELERESTETFAKPWRAHGQQQEENLAYLLRLRHAKQAALAQLVEELQQLDHQLLHVTEAKAVDLGNWRYQQRALRRKLEKLRCGADTLTASLSAAPSRSLQQTVHRAPSWQHSQHVALKELAQVQELLTRQLRQLEKDEGDAQHQLEKWHRLLATLPHDSREDAGGEAQLQTPLKRQQTAHREDGHPGDSRVDNSQTASPAPVAPARDAAQPHEHFRPATDLHPSSAEVVLLQHALHNINDGLRHRLLRAAAASLTSTSTTSTSCSPLPSSSREGTSAGDPPYTSVIAGETTVNASLPLPQDGTPLRHLAQVLPRQSGADTSSPDARMADHAANLNRLQGTAADGLSPPPAPSGHARGVPYGVNETPVSATAAAVHEQESLDEKSAAASGALRWHALQKREHHLREALDALLMRRQNASAVGTERRNLVFLPSSSASSRERSDGDFPAISAMSGALNSLSAPLQDPLEY